MFIDISTDILAEILTGNSADNLIGIAIIKLIENFTVK